MKFEFRTSSTRTRDFLNSVYRQAVLAMLLLVAMTSSAWGAVKTEVSARKIAVGQTVVVQLSATQEDDGDVPSDPQIKVQGQARVSGPSIATQSKITMHNFDFRSEKRIIARWEITPTQTGKLIIGPGSFSLGGKRVSGEQVEIQVVESNQAVPAPRQQRAPNPFAGSPFGSDPFDDFFNQRRARRRMPDAPPEYQLSQAADPVAFLDARVSRREVVIGEPVRLTILAYGALGDFGEMSPKEPGMADFISYRALDNAQAEPAYQTEIQGRTYVVRKIREYILVPLRSGTLSIGEMRTVIQNSHGAYPQSGGFQGFPVSTLPIDLKVSEPPVKDRPVGYFLGDVGQYELQAQVSPREVKQGGFVEVLVKIEGRGQIPSQVILPEQNSVVWEAPTLRGGPEVEDGELQGTRSLKFAVQLKEVGVIELGEVQLPYFDNQSRRYKTAKVSLGSVNVTAVPAGAPSQTPSSQTQSPSPSDNSQLQESGLKALTLLSARADLEMERHTTGLRPALWWWLLLFALPLFLFLGTQSVQLLHTVQVRRGSQPKALFKKDLAQAQAAVDSGQVNEALSRAERALFECVEFATGLKGRGILRSELQGELEKKGMEAALAQKVGDTLLHLETARYGESEVELTIVVQEVARLCERLQKKAKA